MKKGKIAVLIIVAITFFLLVAVSFMQFKLVKETDVTSIETMREEELRSELADWKEKYKEAEEDYNEKSAKLEEYKKSEISTEESAKLVEEQLQKSKEYQGLTKVQGQGIIITLQKSSNDLDEVEIGSEDLLILVDYLRAAGAEAISINEERIINMSDIVDINYSIIYVNQQRILAPYVIKAIGDSTYLKNSLLGNGGYVDELKGLGFDVEIEENKSIEIPAYSKEIGHKYIQ